MKKLRYLLFLSIIFLTPSVFADTTYDMTSRITSPVNYTECGAGSYTGVELNGATNCWNTNTRYQGTLSRVYFNLPAPSGNAFEADTSYRLSLYMATNDWRNRFGTVAVRPGSSYTNNFVDSFSFVSMKQVNITFTVPYGGSTTYQTLWVDLPATNTNTLITGETNWNLSKVTLTKLTSGSGGGSTTPSGPSTSFDDTAIINNANENTQDIINNNNTNTNDIINNANENTENIINSTETSNADSTRNNFDTTDKNCGMLYKYTTLKGRGFYSNGSMFNDDNMYYTDYFIPLDGATKIVLEGFTSTNTGNVIIYDSSQNYLDYWGVRNQTITLPSNARYFRIATTNPYGRIFKDKGCTSKIDDINDTINNPNVDSNTGTGFFDDFTSQDFGLSQIITIPLNTIQSLTSKSCVPLQVPIPFTNSNISLPCMTEIYETKFPSIYNLWKIVSFGIVAYLIAIDIFHIVKGFKDPESDKVEVLDL